jgi:hypothetical protein
MENRMVSLAEMLLSHAEDMCKKARTDADIKWWQAEVNKWTMERARAAKCMEETYMSPREGHNVLGYVEYQAESCEDKIRHAEEGLKSAKSDYTKKKWQKELKMWMSEKARMDAMVLRWSTEPAPPPTPPEEERKRRRILKVSPQSLIIVSSRGPVSGG